MPISDKLKRIYTGQNCSTILIKTLEISNASAGTRYIADWPEPVIAKDENGITRTFEAGAFTINEPGQSATGRADFTIALSNADGQIDAYLEAIKNSADKTTTIIYRVYTEDDLDEPQINPPMVLKASSASRVESSYSITAGRDDLLNRKFPRVVYRATGTESFPGLRR